MTRRRVYLPATLADLEAILAEGALPDGTREAYAVTAGLLAALPRADEEEREYAAFLDAARAAPRAAGRRVIIAADSAPEGVVEGAGSRVEVSGLLRRGDLVSFHVDEEPGGEASDLLCYDITEAPEVLDLLRGVGRR